MKGDEICVKKTFEIPAVNVMQYEVEDIVATSPGGNNGPIVTPEDEF